MSSLTYKDVKAVVTIALGPKVTIIKHRLENFSSQKNGIFGMHQLLIVDFKDESNGQKTHTFFVKSRPESIVTRELMLDECTFLEEGHFYNEVQPLMMKSYVGERWTPRCYLARDDVLVFEDLRAQGFSIRPESLLDETSLRSALSALARFHASSVLAETKLGKTLKEAFPNSFNEKVYTKGNKLGRSTPIGFDTIVRMAERWGLDTSLVPKILDSVWKWVRPRDDRCNVVCHSDLWKNNVMYDSSVPPKCILVDYQLLRYASPVIDFCMLVYLHTTPDYRRVKDLKLLEHYYKVFRDTLLQSDIKAKIPSYESLMNDYEEFKIIGMVCSSTYLPGIYIKSGDFEEMMNEPIATEKFFFHDRMNIIGSNMDKDPVYEKQMKDIISELLEEAKRLFSE